MDCDPLAVLRGRGVRIVAESVGIALREDLHHPAIKIVDRVIHDGFESPIVFSVSFLNVIPQPDADILVLSAETHLLRSQHLNILHRNFGHPIRATVKLHDAVAVAGLRSESEGEEPNRRVVVFPVG